MKKLLKQHLYVRSLKNMQQAGEVLMHVHIKISTLNTEYAAKVFGKTLPFRRSHRKQDCVPSISEEQQTVFVYLSLQ